MSISDNLKNLKKTLNGSNCRLIVVSKTYPVENILEAYQSNQKDFGENKVQEMSEKYSDLPKDIRWHLIGHLQSNKVKYIAPFVHLIHSVDSYKLLTVINKEALKNNRVINCLLQIYIANEETKFGLTFQEAEELLFNPEIHTLTNINIIGFMGMATNTNDMTQIRMEFKKLKDFFEKMKTEVVTSNVDIKELSMGMSSDYIVAMEEGSTMIRVGSAIFGNRNYH